MTNTAPQQTFQRYLPPTHEREGSPFYVAPEHREDYRFVELGQHDLKEVHEVATARAQHRYDLARWKRELARIQSFTTNQPERTQQWLKRYTVNGDGVTPKLALVNNFDGKIGGEYVAANADDVALAQHEKVVELARSAHDARVAQAKSEKARAEHERRMMTCEVCADYPVSTDTLAGDSDVTRVCTPCAALIPTARAVRKTTNAGRPRTDVVAQWVSHHPGDDGHDDNARSSTDTTEQTAATLREIVARRRARRGR